MLKEEAEDLAEEIRLYFSDVRVERVYDKICVIEVYVADGLFRRFINYEDWIEYREKIEHEEKN